MLAAAALADPPSQPAVAHVSTRDEIVVGVCKPATVKGFVHQMPDGSLDGFAVRIAAAAAEAVGLRAEFVALGDADPVEALASGRVDAVCPMSVKEERLATIAYSAPLVIAHGAVFARPGAPSAGDARSLAAGRVLVARAGIAHQWCVERGIPFETRETLREALEEVARGEADYVVTTQSAGRYDAEFHHLKGLVERRLDDERLWRAFAFAVRVDDVPLRIDLNNGLAIIRDDGRFGAIYREWFEKYQPRDRPPMVPLRWLAWAGLAGAGAILAVLAWYWILRRLLRRRTRQLQESEARLGALMENVPGLVYAYFVGNDGARRILYANSYLDSFERLFPGFDVSGDYRRTIMPRIHPDDAAGYEAAVAASRDRGVPFDIEYRLRTVAGDDRWLHAKLVAQDQPGGRLWHGLLMDVTAQRAAEESIRESEAKYRRIFERSSDAIILFCADDRAILEANDSALGLYGYPRDALIGMPVERLSDAPHEAAERIRRTLEAGSLEPFVARHRRENGAAFDAELAASAVEYRGRRAILLLVRDVTERLRAEDLVKRSEERYRAFVANSTEALWRIEIDPPVPTELTAEAQIELLCDRAWLAECNDAFAQMYGASRAEDLVGRRLDKLIRRDDPANLEHHSALIAAGYRIRNRLTHETDAAGQHRAFLNNAVGFIENGCLVRVWGTQQDVTAQHEAQRALERSEERYRAFIANSTEGVWRFEVFPPISTGLPADEQVALLHERAVLAECNDAMAHMHGVASAEDLVGVRLPRLLRTDQPSNLEHQRTFVAAGYRLRNAESQETDIHGRSRYFVNNATGFVEDGCLVRIWGTQQDVTAQREAQRALVQSEQRLRAILHNAPNVAIQGYDLDGRVLFWNKSSERLFGWTEAEALGKTLDRLILSEPQAREFAQQIRELDREGGVKGPFETECRSREGRSSWVYSTLSRIPGTDGAYQFVCMDVDITARVEAEHEARRLEEKLQQTQRLESLGVLAGGVAHDFNNLLIGILGNAELALSGLPEGSPARESLELIERAALQAADLTRQMLAYAGKARMVAEPIDLSRLVQETATLLKASIRKSATLQLDLARDLPAAEADASQVRQVVMNLITNASDALPESGGLICLRTGTMEADEAYLREAIGTANPGRFVYVEVTDTGSGIDAQAMPRIFEPFFTTKFTGRGLGLAAALGIMRRHHGAIRVTTAPGEGTTFRALFPASTAARPSAPSGTPEGARLAPGSRILVVDDEAIVRDMVAMALRSEGVDVLTASDGASAIDQVRAEPLTGVLLDLTMPAMGGEQVLIEIKRIAPDLPVVVMSGYAEEEVQHRIGNGHGVGFLHKPFTLRELSDRVRSMAAG